MDYRSIPRTRGRDRVPAALLLAVVTFHGFAGPASAHPIRAHRLHESSTHQESRLGTAWTRFLDGGSALWSRVRPPIISSGMILATSASGQLVETPFVDYLYWRRSLNPARFDRYHPILGPELGLLTPPVALPPATVPPPSTNAAGGLLPPSRTNTPEPGTIPTALTLIAAGLWFRAKYRRGGDGPGCRATL